MPNVSSLLASVVLSGLVGFLGGCRAGRNSAPTANLPSAAPTTAAPSAAIQRLDELQQHLADLSRTVQQLPGPTEASDRRLMAGALDQLGAIIANLGYNQPGGTIPQAIQIIRHSSDQLLRQGPGMPPVAATNTALRNAYVALNVIARQSYGAQAHIGQLLDRLHRRVNDLDAVTVGALYRFEAAQAVTDAAAVARAMADVLATRLAWIQRGSAPAATPPSANAAVEPQ